MVSYISSRISSHQIPFDVHDTPSDELNKLTPCADFPATQPFRLNFVQ